MTAQCWSEPFLTGVTDYNESKLVLWQCAGVQRQTCSGMPIQQVILSQPHPSAWSEGGDPLLADKLAGVYRVAAVRTAYWLCFVGIRRYDSVELTEIGTQDDESQSSVKWKLVPLCAVQVAVRLAHAAWCPRCDVVALLQGHCCKE